MNSKTKTLVGIGLFTAIVFVLQFLSMFTRFATFSLTFVLVPIVVGAAMYGWKAGAWLGFVFGVAVLATGDAALFLAVNPLATVLVVLIKGTACGLVAGLVYKCLESKRKHLAVVVAAISAPVVNTGIFLIGCRLFFYETVSGWGVAAGFDNAAAYMFIGLAGINFIIELAINIILAPTISRLIKIGKKS